LGRTVENMGRTVENTLKIKQKEITKSSTSLNPALGIG
jgi:hypothetical protein